MQVHENSSIAVAMSHKCQKSVSVTYEWKLHKVCARIKRRGIATTDVGIANDNNQQTDNVNKMDDFPGALQKILLDALS